MPPYAVILRATEPIGPVPPSNRGRTRSWTTGLLQPSIYNMVRRSEDCAFAPPAVVRNTDGMKDLSITENRAALRSCAALGCGYSDVVRHTTARRACLRQRRAIGAQSWQSAARSATSRDAAPRDIPLPRRRLQPWFANPAFFAFAPSRWPRSFSWRP